jgi:uncharacterized membrane protein YqaE (UPF0057 family)
MNKLYVIFMMMAAFMMAAPAFAGQSVSSMESLSSEAPIISKKEMKAQKKAMRKAVRKATLKNIFKKDSSKPAEADILAIILAIFIPPLGVWYYEGQITTKFWIALVLTLLLAWIPGAIYALLVVMDVI